MIERSRFLIPALCAVVYFIAAIVPANAEAPFPDVPAESWAYGAIKQLVDDGLITGYPDGTFKGDRPLTRYEASYLLSKAIAAIKERIAQGRPAPPPTDVALVNRLSETLAADLEDVSKRVAALEHETAALEK